MLRFMPLQLTSVVKTAGGFAGNARGATNTAAIARNAIAMLPVNWVAICWRRKIAVVVDIIGRGFFFCFVSFGLLLGSNLRLWKSLIVGHRCVFANRGRALIERLI